MSWKLLVISIGVLMALFYTRTFLKAVSTSLINSQLRPELWRSLTQMGIAKQRPTRRGCRSGKQTTIRKLFNIVNATTNSSLSVEIMDNFVEHQEETSHLHNSPDNLLNIQNHTYCEDKINTSQSTEEPQEEPVKSNYNVPKVLLTNVRSLVPKIDEISEFITRNEIYFTFITETWLRSSISDGVISIPNFALVRRDRKTDNHGGVCAYIKEEQCKYKVLDELYCCEDHEILCLHLRPNRLPQGF